MQNNNKFTNNNPTGTFPINTPGYHAPYVVVYPMQYPPMGMPGHQPSVSTYPQGPRPRPQYQPQQQYQQQSHQHPQTQQSHSQQTRSFSKTSHLSSNAAPFNPRGTTTARNPTTKNTSTLNPAASAYNGNFHGPMVGTPVIPIINAPVYPNPNGMQPVSHMPIPPITISTQNQTQPVSQPATQSVIHPPTHPVTQPPTQTAVQPNIQPVQPNIQPVAKSDIPPPSLNLVPRSRRGSIVDRPRDVITEEKIKEMNGSYANPNKFVYVPELLSAIWEHTDRKTLVLPEYEHVNPYKWNISIRSKITAQGILGDIQSLLNKLTLENFDSIYKTFVSRKPTRIEEYKGIISLVYDKAVMEPHFATMYAKLCRLMNRDYPAVIRSLIYAKAIEGGYTCYENGDDKKALCEPAASEEQAFEKTLKSITVRRLVANKCQDELETEGKTLVLEQRRNELKELLKQNEDDVKVAAELMDVEFKINTIRRRTFGNVQFIGELFNCGLLRVEAVIKASFDHLITPVESADDEKTEALCKLLTTVGKTMYDNPKFSNLLEDTVSRIAMLEKSSSLTSRVRFAVSDLIDLAENMWQSDQKEKLEKLSDLRMKKTIQCLEGIIEMLEKRTSHHKSTRSPPPPAAAAEVPKTIASEVVPAITQTKQATFDLFSGSVRNGLQEAKSSRDSEDFWYNLETKVKDGKNTMSEAISSTILYACENIKLESPELTLLYKVMDYGFENNKLNEMDFINAFASSLQLLDYMDSPSRFKMCKALTAHFVEKNEITGKELDAMLSQMEEDPSLSYVVKSLK